MAAARFFQQAHELVRADVFTRQEVISAFATEKGLNKIKDLLDLPWDKMEPQRLHQRFDTTFMPFLELLTNDKVLSSGVLEVHLGTIYAFLCGLGGARGTALFSIAVRFLQSCRNLISADVDNQILFRLLLVASAFHLMVRASQQARITPGTNTLFDQITEVAMALDGRVSSSQLGCCRRDLREASIRLDYGKDIPFLHRNHQQDRVGNKVSFKLDRAGPGIFGNAQPRHDNDHQDIENIQILPTFDEIVNTMPEYLPLLDPDTWHKQGLAGPLDRHFRLLREDTIGQLRDRIRTELERLQQPPGEQIKAGANSHWVLDNANVEVPHFDKSQGLEAVVSFDQPKHIRGLGIKDRKARWEQSRHLQPYSVVCLLTTMGRVVFCRVVREFQGTRTPYQGSETVVPRPSRDDVSLHHNAKRASVLVQPVRLDSSSVENLIYLHQFGESAGKCTLVEFPGILLPAFMPTLEALQALSQSGTMPFEEFLVPDTSTNDVHIPPPAYASDPDFSMSLSSICKRDATMSFQPNNSSPSDHEMLHASSSLDRSQAQTVLDALSRKLAHLQGPPGTGKSFVGVHLVRLLADQKERSALGPIVCVCYTNHALDQLLEHLLDKGITQIARIGAASKSTRISQLNIRDLARKDDTTKLEKFEAYLCKANLEENANHINHHLNDLSLSGTAETLGGDVPDPERWQIQKNKQKQKQSSPQQKLHHWLRGGSKRQSITQDRHIDELKDADIHAMSNNERHALHQAWMKMLFDQKYDAIERHRKRFTIGKDRLQVVRSELDLRVLEQADVIGVTTSGLARNLNALRKLSSKVLLCEEAGEVLESHLLTALLPNIEHAILIGDHLQLRPHVGYHLSRESNEGEKYSLDLSLFERLVVPDGPGGSNLPYSTLETQRRMHPTIANLVRSTLYPRLVDDPPVYDDICGMKKRLFWLDHRNAEVSKHDTESMQESHSNDFEVEMVAALVSHLIKQGQRRPDEIAVLTPYLGQLRKLRARLSGLFELTVDQRDEDDLQRAGFADSIPTSLAHKTALDQAVRIATIDNFQGEEAPIVVISLVRSNDKHQCGFLRTQNRINVLLSRAQQGMYIIGDVATCGGVPMWKDVIELLEADENIGTSLPLECARHPEHDMKVVNPDDFLRLCPDGPSLCGEVCPSIAYCQNCGTEDAKGTQVDLIMFTAYSEHDLSDSPCIFLPCGHFFTVETLDGIVGLSTYYESDESGQPISLKDLPYDLDIDQTKIVCPNCRKSLRNISRYGRPIRRALLIQSTLKFITWSNREYAGLMSTFLDLKAELNNTQAGTTSKVKDIKLEGPSDRMTKAIRNVPGSDRYANIVAFRKALNKYSHDVRTSEQPFRKVQDLVTFANRRKASSSVEPFSFPASTVLQTKASRLSACLLLRCDLAILMDYFSIRRNSPGETQTFRLIDTSTCHQRCREIITACAADSHVMQEAEAHIFLAQFAALEINRSTFPDGSAAHITSLRTEAQEHLDKAKALQARHPGQTKALAPDVEATEKMLADQVFYSAVSDEEIRVAVKAMQTEFLSTGHWYRCVNGHPFTVGECGMPMAQTRCPECGAPVGGRDHVAAEGVQRADDLGAIERGIGGLDIQR
ncbi:NFX1-type zinc finger-containing protein 1 [Elsinoe australis]|uniref:NFX1-type zinc finger-containing protein 1 n=1 Tax=Elsinoe australis TaxID=40998 RepID=A0A2P8AI88_9PEZI|nr:NFX1-type zinc finger-containing protein 1 [Elsinoe australis]